jgi:hypothetical protein
MEPVVELASRSSLASDVSLFWDRRTNLLFVQVLDWQTDDDFTLQVRPECALEVYNHPYAARSDRIVEATTEHSVGSNV